MGPVIKKTLLDQTSCKQIKMMECLMKRLVIINTILCGVSVSASKYSCADSLKTSLGIVGEDVRTIKARNIPTDAKTQTKRIHFIRLFIMFFLTFITFYDLNPSPKTCRGITQRCW